jgi:hypothetical protein
MVPAVVSIFDESRECERISISWIMGRKTSSSTSFISSRNCESETPAARLFISLFNGPPPLGDGRKRLEGDVIRVTKMESIFDFGTGRVDCALSKSPLRSD